MFRQERVAEYGPHWCYEHLDLVIEKLEILEGTSSSSSNAVICCMQLILAVLTNRCELGSLLLKRYNRVPDICRFWKSGRFPSQIS